VHGEPDVLCADAAVLVLRRPMWRRDGQLRSEHRVPRLRRRLDMHEWRVRLRSGSGVDDMCGPVVWHRDEQLRADRVVRGERHPQLRVGDGRMSTEWHVLHAEHQRVQRACVRTCDEQLRSVHHLPEHLRHRDDLLGQHLRLRARALYLVQRRLRGRKDRPEQLRLVRKRLRGRVRLLARGMQMPRQLRLRVRQSVLRQAVLLNRTKRRKGGYTQRILLAD
jgi:hypothetical protein